VDISFILVEPKVPENLGSAARAIKTMGFKNLSLVNPCEFNEGKARWVAHGSNDILDDAKVFNTLLDAVKEYDLVIGTTARHRVSKSEYIEISQLRTFLEARRSEYNKIAIVFGKEESGLTNEQLDLCDVTSTIPMAVNFPSLNLAQAVMLYAFILNKNLNNEETNNDQGNNSRSLSTLKEKMEKLLEGTDISRNKVLKGRIMERLALASVTDIKLLHSITNSLLNKYDKARK